MAKGKNLLAITITALYPCPLYVIKAFFKVCKAVVMVALSYSKLISVTVPSKLGLYPDNVLCIE